MNSLEDEEELELEDTSEFQQRLTEYFQQLRKDILANGGPLADWDPILKKAYLLWPDGRKEYLDN